ncbi:MAG: hypothetical protein GY742_22530, partial [Hyphomicrobiales bacterium]|nr:hypothetical protein [Hyphomicrobiales bacterium]
SAVMGLRWQASDRGRMYISTNTEAVILDLDGRGTVYVLNARMGNNNRAYISYWPYLILRTFGMKGNGKLKDFPRLRSAQGRYPVEPLVGGPPQLPLMVAFRDETKRETMFEIKPGDFAGVFGSDVRFAGLWFEFTDDPVTNAIIERLPLMMGKVNPSYRKAFPLRDRNGKLIPAVDHAFPQKLGKPAFFRRDY